MRKFRIKRLAFDFVANGRDTVWSSIPTSVAIDLLDRSGLRCKISLASLLLLVLRQMPSVQIHADDEGHRIVAIKFVRDGADVLGYAVMQLW